MTIHARLVEQARRLIETLVDDPRIRALNTLFTSNWTTSWLAKEADGKLYAKEEHDDETKEIMREIFNSMVRQENMTPEVIQKGMQRGLNTTGRYAHWLRCTNYFRYICTKGCTADSTPDNLLDQGGFR